MEFNLEGHFNFSPNNPKHQLIQSPGNRCAFPPTVLFHMSSPRVLVEGTGTHTHHLQMLSIKKVHEAIIFIRQSGSHRRLGREEWGEGPWLAALSLAGGKLQDRSHAC